MVRLCAGPAYIAKASLTSFFSNPMQGHVKRVGLRRRSFACFLTLVLIKCLLVSADAPSSASEDASECTASIRSSIAQALGYGISFQQLASLQPGSVNVFKQPVFRVDEDVACGDDGSIAFRTENFQSDNYTSFSSKSSSWTKFRQEFQSSGSLRFGPVSIPGLTFGEVQVDTQYDAEAGCVQHDFSMAAMAFRSYFTVTLRELSSPEIDPLFLKALLMLPDAGFEAAPQPFLDLIDQYGTHVLIASEFGVGSGWSGKISALDGTCYKRCDYSFTAAARAGLLKLGLPVSVLQVLLYTSLIQHAIPSFRCCTTSSRDGLIGNEALLITAQFVGRKHRGF
jgi:hypothetical protein